MEQIEKIQGTEKEFIKVFQELCYSRSSWQVWADLMAAMACTLANSVDKTEPRYTAREKEYAECIKRLGGVEKEFWYTPFYFRGEWNCRRQIQIFKEMCGSWITPIEERNPGKITFYFDFEKGDYKCQNS